MDPLGSTCVWVFRSGGRRKYELFHRKQEKIEDEKISFKNHPDNLSSMDSIGEIEVAEIRKKKTTYISK